MSLTHAVPASPALAPAPRVHSERAPCAFSQREPRAAGTTEHSGPLGPLGSTAGLREEGQPCPRGGVRELRAEPWCRGHAGCPGREQPPCGEPSTGPFCRCQGGCGTQKQRELKRVHRHCLTFWGPNLAWCVYDCGSHARGRGGG